MNKFLQQQGVLLVFANLSYVLKKKHRPFRGFLVLRRTPDEYLSCFKTKCNGTGRADARHAPNMSRYRRQVLEANMDKDASMTQAKTLNGFVLQRANWAAEDVTRELKDAAKDYLSYSKAWWQ